MYSERSQGLVIALIRLRLFEGQTGDHGEVTIRTTAVCNLDPSLSLPLLAPSDRGEDDG